VLRVLPLRYRLQLRPVPRLLRRRLRSVGGRRGRRRGFVPTSRAVHHAGERVRYDGCTLRPGTVVRAGVDGCTHPPSSESSSAMQSGFASLTVGLPPARASAQAAPHTHATQPLSDTHDEARIGGERPACAAPSRDAGDGRLTSGSAADAASPAGATSSRGGSDRRVSASRANQRRPAQPRPNAHAAPCGESAGVASDTVAGRSSPPRAAIARGTTPRTTHAGAPPCNGACGALGGRSQGAAVFRNTLAGSQVMSHPLWHACVRWLGGASGYHTSRSRPQRCCSLTLDTDRCVRLPYGGHSVQPSSSPFPLQQGSEPQR
jgi:hypothetical protein